MMHSMHELGERRLRGQTRGRVERLAFSLFPFLFIPFHFSGNISPSLFSNCHSQATVMTDGIRLRRLKEESSTFRCFIVFFLLCCCLLLCVCIRRFLMWLSVRLSKTRLRFPVVFMPSANSPIITLVILRQYAGQGKKVRSQGCAQRSREERWQSSVM